MKKFLFLIFLASIIVVSFPGCTSSSKTISATYPLVELTKADFVLSEQVSAEATSVRVFGIDWARLFAKDEGFIGANYISLPIVGGLVSNNAQNEAVHNLIEENPGYDVVFYPQYHEKCTKPILGLGFIIKVTEVNVKARLGKL